MMSKRLFAAVSVSLLFAGALFWMNSRRLPEETRRSDVADRLMEKRKRSGGERLETKNGVNRKARENGPVESQAEMAAASKHRNAPAEVAVAPVRKKVDHDGEVRGAPHETQNEAGPGETAVSKTPVGIRLADDVRLPAAAMPVDFKMSPVAEKMLKEIVNDYYRELAASAVPDSADESVEGGDPTVVVPNGPIAESARQRADHRFRALFGNSAYNRMTMNSAFETRLPVAQAADGTNGGE